MSIRPPLFGSQQDRRAEARAITSPVVSAMTRSAAPRRDGDPQRAASRLPRAGVPLAAEEDLGADAFRERRSTVGIGRTTRLLTASFLHNQPVQPSTVTRGAPGCIPWNLLSIAEVFTSLYYNPTFSTPSNGGRPTSP